MLKKLLHGFLFGTGFSIAVIIAIWLSAFYPSETSLSSQFSESNETASFGDIIEWQETSTSEKIDKIDAIALVRFNEREDNFMEAYVEEVITKNDNISIPLSIGDRVEKSDYYGHSYPQRNRNGILLMYVGNPAKEMEGAFLYEDRLVSHGDMPLELFIKRFEDAQ